LRINNAKDFDDLIIDTLELLELDGDEGKAIKKRYSHVLCDEWQDVDKSQYMLLKLLVSSDTQNKRSLFVVGDSYQTIYSWRGADHRNMDKFSQDFPACLSFRLTVNYRSDQEIVRASKSLIINGKKLMISKKKPEEVKEEDLKIKKNEINQEFSDSFFLEGGNALEDVLGGDTKSSNKGPAVVVTSAFRDEEQAEYVAHMIHYMLSTDQVDAREVAIMYRRHSQSTALEAALLARKVPYSVVGGTGVTDRKEVKDALAYLRLLTNPYDGEALKRVINYPPRGVGLTTQDVFFSAHFNISHPQIRKCEEEYININEKTFLKENELTIVDLLIQLGISMDIKTKEKEKEKELKLRGKKGSKKSDDDYYLRAARGVSTDVRTPDDDTNIGGTSAQSDMTVGSTVDLFTPRQLKALGSASKVISDLQGLVMCWEGGIAELVDIVLVKSGLRAYLEQQTGLTDKEKSQKLARFTQLISLARRFDHDFETEDLTTQGEGGARERLRSYLDTFQLTANGEGEETGDGDIIDDVYSDMDMKTYDINNRNMIQQKKKEMAEQSVKLLTLHASKGLEFDCVFICGVEEGFLPSHASISRLVVSDERHDEGLKVTIDESNEFQLEEERRLLYVGMTRARRKLFLTYRERIDLGNGKLIPVSPSRFLKDLPPDILVSKYHPPVKKNLAKSKYK